MVDPVGLPMQATVEPDTAYLGLGAGMESEPRVAYKAVTELHREGFALTWQKMFTHGIAAIGATVRIELDIQVVLAAQADGAPVP
ncbi:hypothetical protein AB0D11_45935 [Streptomyces monashensis]|uniref:hypothetical protein n=1 Tax=Streptomyces monashensis TaxID=1678012 RepID=UPI0033E70628